MHKLRSIMLARLSMVLIAAMAWVSAPDRADAQTDPYLGTIAAFGFNFCPRGWVPAGGQLLPISSNTALFSLFGTTYGGDGRTTFGMPDLRGRAPINYGSGPGLQHQQLGQRGGSESFTLTVPEMPSHSHIVNATNTEADQRGPGGDFVAYGQSHDGNEIFMYHDGPPNKTMDPRMIANTGGSQSVIKRSPYLALNWCVATVGIYPSRP